MVEMREGTAAAVGYDSARGRGERQTQGAVVPEPPTDSEQVRRTRAAAQQTVDDVAATTERILRERDEGERPPRAAPKETER